MTGQLAGKVAVVTGGGSGIGTAIAVAFGRAGATVAVVDISGEQEVVAKGLGGDALAVEADVTCSDSVRSMFDTVREACGRIDVVCNNAGIFGPAGRITELSEEDFDRVLSVNLRGAYLGMRHGIPHLLANGGGAVVNVASVAGLVGLPGASSYSASKAGVIGMTRAVALEYASAGIRVNAVCPGFVETPMAQELFGADEERRRRSTEQVPVRRLARAEEIAAAALYLAGDAASYVTGTVLTVDGGYTAR